MRVVTSCLIGLVVVASAACTEESSVGATSDASGASMVDSGPDVSGDLLTPTSNSLVGVAASAGSFETLLAALDAAGLTETLGADGPFTVFAPTDEAFAALPEGTVEALLEDIPALTDVLLYHVVDGAVDATTVSGLSLVETLQGSDVKVTVDGDVFVSGAQVVVTDILADNGIIHVIDAVMLPPADIVTIASSDPQFSTLVAALSAADLAETLSGDGPFTVFAPTDAAFAALPEGTVEALLEDIPALTDVLLYHVVDGKLSAGDVLTSASITMLQGSEAGVAVDAGGASIAGADIVVTDIPAANGVIHVISSVMLPE